MSKSKTEQFLKDGSRETLAEREARVARVVAAVSAVLPPVEPHGAVHARNATN